MGIFGNFNLPPDSKSEKISLINRQALEKEEKRKKAEEVRISEMIQEEGMTREDAEAKIAEEEAEILERMIKQYPPGSGDQEKAA